MDDPRALRPLARAAVAVALLCPAPAFAQRVLAATGTGETEAGPARPADPRDDEETVVVSARRQRGAVFGDLAPELQLGAADIRSLGVTSVDELLAELAPELRSLRGGPPIVLLEGRRLSSFAELRDVPAEAIVRVDVLPEAAAVAYGYSANQKVMNVVLRPRFRAWTGEARAGGATESGAANARAAATVMRIRRDARFNASVQASHGDPLTEAQRGIVPAAPRAPFDLLGNVAGLPLGSSLDPTLSALVGAPVTVAGVPASARSRPLTLADLLPNANRANRTDLADRRTLLPRTDGASANLVWNRALEGGTTITLNGSVQRDEQRARNGLPGVLIVLPAGGAFSPFAGTVGVYRYVDTLGALSQATESTQSHVGLTVDGSLGSWRWNLVGNLVNGVCLTATRVGADEFAADVSRETLAVTTLASLAPGARVNLEPALRAGESLGGHLVSGHVDGVAEVMSLAPDARSVRVTIRVPAPLARYVARKGSVAVDGVSLTVNRVEGDLFDVNLVPHTQEATILGEWMPGRRVNLEVDQVARYVERLTGN